MVDWEKELEKNEVAKTNEVSLADGWFNTDIVEAKGHTLFVIEGMEDKLVEFLKLQEKFERAKKQIIDDIKKVARGRESMSCDSTKVNISYTPSRVSQRFNSTRFKQEHPDLYEQYCEESEVAASVRISLKQPRETKGYIVKDGVIIDNETGMVIAKEGEDK